MSDRLTPAQIRGARGMLNWSMADLSRAARMSISTVKRAEDGTSRSVSDDAHSQMRAALEMAGVQFLPGGPEGLGLRLRDVETQAEAERSR